MFVMMGRVHFSSLFLCICAFLLRICIACTHQEMVFDMEVRQYGQVTAVEANSSLIVHAYGIPPDVSSVMFQAHSQKYSILMSKSERVLPNSSVAGGDVGLIHTMADTESSVKMWIHNNNNENITVLVIIMSYSSDDPVPGGCNMEFPVNISPFLHLFYDDVITKLEYQHANIGHSRRVPPPSCSKTSSLLSYDIYVSYLNENSFKEEDYFKGILEMSNTTSIYKVAKKAKIYSLHPGTRTSFYTYPNVGVVYNVITRYEKNGVIRETSYVPVASYGCKLVSEDYGCYYSASIIPRPVFLLLTLYATFQVFFGHIYFNGEMFFFGFLAFSFIGYILLAKYAALPETARFAAAASIGVAGGLFWLGVWNLIGRPVVALLLVGFVLGFLLSCTALYSPLGSYNLFTNDQNYWLSLGCGTLLVTAVLLPFPKALSIIATSVVGSFVAIVSYEQDLRGSLPYIIINVIKRALRGGLSVADNEYPFEKNEIISSSVWAAISVLGILVQCCLQRGRPDFPKPCDHSCCCCCPRLYFTCDCRHRECNQSRMVYPHEVVCPSERQPLLARNHMDSSIYQTLPSEIHSSYGTANQNQSMYSSAISYTQSNGASASGVPHRNTEGAGEGSASAPSRSPPPPYAEH